jgi:predicted 2-oxoglutarate/Fe(II)-dependent dioxygenase YbiX
MIARGERVPDFALPRGDRQDTTRFYGVVGGRPGVLILAGAADTAAVVDLVTALDDGHGDTLDVHVVACGPSSALPNAFHDRDRTVHHACGSSGDVPIAIVVDPNVRVAATVAIRDADAALTTILDELPRWPDDDGAPAPRLAPVLFVPHALDASLCDELMERWYTEGSVETGVETVVDGERAEATDVRRKRRRDHTITDRRVLRQLTQHIGARVFPELQKAFAFRAAGFEGFKIGCYEAAHGGHFVAHRDNLSAGTAHRRFGLTLNLNDDYTGGELRFPEYGPARYRPAAGEALVFSGSHLHEVLPVERGRRFVLLSFILDASSQR